MSASKGCRRLILVVSILLLGMEAAGKAMTRPAHLPEAMEPGRWQQNPERTTKPLSLRQVQKLTVIAPDSVVAGEIRERGLSFKTTSRIVAQLKNLGAGAETLAVLTSLILPNGSPSMTLEADRTEFLVGQSVQLRAKASDPDDDPLHYRWFTSAGSIEGDGPTVRLNTTDIVLDSSSDSVLVGLEIDDQRGGTARQAIALSINKPNHPPSVKLKAEKTEFLAGESLSLKAEASDPDGDRLQYVWSATAGAIEGDGSVVKLKTEGVSMESDSVRIEVGLKVRDGRGGTKTAAVSLWLKKPPPVAIISPRVIQKVRPVYPTFARMARLSGRVVVEVEIDASGHVVSAKAVDGLSALRQAAVEAVKKWKFRPATQGGKPIEYRQNIAFDFTTQGKP